MTDDDDQGTDEGEANVMLHDEEVDEGELSVMSLLGLPATRGQETRTIRLRGKIQDVPILLLVDSGATHNFISQKLVRAMGWQVNDTTSLHIKLGDGYKAKTRGECKGVRIELEKIEFEIDAFLFDLDGIDIVLGMAWLNTIGEIRVDWPRQIMRFRYDNAWVELRGAISVDTHHSALQSLLSKTRICVEGLYMTAEGRVVGVPAQQRAETVRLTRVQELEVQELLTGFQVVFQEPKGLPPKRSHEHVIHLLEGQGPVNVRPYRYSHHHKAEIEKQVQEMLQLGIIRPSQSAFSRPVILVKKKDGSWRMCVNYRALNKVTVPDKFPILVIEELLDELHGAKFFSKIDLKSGYHQVRMRTEDIHKTAFRTHEGHYEYLVMPFGMMNAPSTFQALMNAVFKPMLRRYVLVFFDDILIYSPTWEQHLLHLKSVLQALVSHKLVANRKKCHFAQFSVEYLGHIISFEGVAMDPSKISCVLQWPSPKNAKGVRGFLGLTGYYRKFIRDYGKLAKPLTELTKKDGFRWGVKEQQAFDVLKQKVTTAPVLALPDFTQEFFIESDASGNGLGAILLQQGRPIAYFSKALGDRNLAKSTYEKELMVVVLAIQHWRPYLLGRKFTVYGPKELETIVVIADNYDGPAKLGSKASWVPF